MHTFGWFSRAAFASLFCLSFVSSAACSQDITVAAQPAQLTIFPGQQNIPVTITTASSTYSGPLDITLTGLPSGITVSPLTINAGSSGILKVSASISAGEEGFSIQLGAANSRTSTVNVIAAAGPVQAVAPLALTISLSNPSFVPSEINLPVIKVDTAGAAITNKTVNVPGTISITSSDGSTSFLPNSGDADNTMTIHLHGNSTLLFPKKAYKIKLGTSTDLLTTMGMTCPYVNKGKPICDKSKSYILLANYDDKTLLRDWAASALANAIPIGNGFLDSPAGSPTPSGTGTLMPWAPHSLFVELFVNGEYEGNYQLIEEVKVDSHRVNINELAETDATDDISGGYLLEIDGHKSEDYVFTTPQGLPIGLEDPDYTPEVPQQTSYITDYVDTAENALFSADFTDPVQGWRAYFDEASAVNFYIINSVMGNPDAEAFYSSNYLYKDKDNGLLYMGPIWDFDICCGNYFYPGYGNPFTPQMQTRAIWYTQWFKDPAFSADVATQWNALKNSGIFTTWLASIQSQATTLEQSQANNFGRWPMQGIEVWPNMQAAGSYDGEIAYLIGWLNARIATLDSKFNAKAATKTTLIRPTGTIRQGIPVTLSATVSGGKSPSGAVTFTSWNQYIGSAPLNNGTASLSAALPLSGDNRVYAWYLGDNANASSSTSSDIAADAPQVLSFTSIAGPNLSNGSSLVFSAAVLPVNGTVIPTGSVSLSIDGVVLSTAALDGAGDATFSTGTLSEGPHTLLASYGGDTNFLPSTSNPRTFVIKNPGTLTLSATSLTFSNQDVTTSSTPQEITLSDTGTGTVNLTGITQTGDFSQTNTCGTTIAPGGTCVISVVFSPTQIGSLAGAINIADDAPGSPQVIALAGTGTAPGITISAVTGGSTTATVAAGQTASYSLLVSASPGFNGAVSLTCAGVPVYAACALSPASVTLADGGSAAFMVTVTTKTTTSNAMLQGPKVIGVVLLSITTPLLFTMRSRKRRFFVFLFIILSIPCLVAVSGCGGKSTAGSTSTTVTSPGTYTLSVTATGSGASNSQKLTLIVQ
jgi:hypothetical protein